MNRKTVAMGAAYAMLLTGCGLAEPDPSNSILKLPPCTGEDTVFASLAIESASNVYHSTIARVVDAHFEQISSIHTRPLQCTANDYRGLLQPSSELQQLADQLPEWGPSRGAELSEADLSSVLLEYLRVYECSLFQRRKFLEPTIVKEMGTPWETPTGTKMVSMNAGAQTQEASRQRGIIQSELATARPTLERTLAFIGGIDRLRPLAAELECLKRASLDLRNATGLISEAASCMPKIWDSRGSLRDLSD